MNKMHIKYNNDKILLKNLEMVNKISLLKMRDDFDRALKTHSSKTLTLPTDNVSKLMLVKLELTNSKQKCCQNGCVKYASYHDLLYNKKICWFHCYVADS